MNPLPTPTASAVVAYIRTSSAEQGKRFGPAAQRETIRRFAAAEGLRIVAEVHEDVSGTVRADDRPGMQDAIAAAFRWGAGSLVVAERSRLAREEFVAHDALRALKGVGLGVLYADGGNGDDDSDLLLDGIGHVLAAHDRRRTVARLKAGRDAKAAEQPHSRAQGGRLPHGYRRTPDGGVAIDAEAAAEVRAAFELVRDLPLAKAAAALGEATGRRWQPKTLERIIRRDDYRRAQPGRIVDPRVWTAANAALDARRRRP